MALLAHMRTRDDVDLLDAPTREELDRVVQHRDVHQRKQHLRQGSPCQTPRPSAVLAVDSAHAGGSWWAPRTLGTSSVVGRNCVVKESANTTACWAEERKVSAGRLARLSAHALVTRESRDCAIEYHGKLTPGGLSFARGPGGPRLHRLLSSLWSLPSYLCFTRVIVRKRRRHGQFERTHVSEKVGVMDQLQYGTNTFNANNGGAEMSNSEEAINQIIYRVRTLMPQNTMSQNTQTSPMIFCIVRP